MVLRHQSAPAVTAVTVVSLALDALLRSQSVLRRLRLHLCGRDLCRLKNRGFATYRDRKKNSLALTTRDDLVLLAVVVVVVVVVPVMIVMVLVHVFGTEDNTLSPLSKPIEPFQPASVGIDLLLVGSSTPFTIPAALHVNLRS